MSCGTPAFIARMRLRSGSNVQLSAKRKLPNTFTFSVIGVRSPASFTVPSGSPARNSPDPGCWGCASAAVAPMQSARPAGKARVNFIASFLLFVVLRQPERAAASAAAPSVPGTIGTRDAPADAGAGGAAERILLSAGRGAGRRRRRSAGSHSPADGLLLVRARRARREERIDEVSDRKTRGRRRRLRSGLGDRAAPECGGPDTGRHPPNGDRRRRGGESVLRPESAAAPVSAVPPPPGSSE